jgi:hypothetical protein
VIGTGTASPAMAGNYSPLVVEYYGPRGEAGTSTQAIIESPAGRPPIPLETTMRYLRAMKSCPHFTPRSGCGCLGNLCAIGKGRHGTVNEWECFECIEGQEKQRERETQEKAEVVSA